MTVSELLRPGLVGLEKLPETTNRLSDEVYHEQTPWSLLAGASTLCECSDDEDTEKQFEREFGYPEPPKERKWLDTGNSSHRLLLFNEADYVWTNQPLNRKVGKLVKRHLEHNFPDRRVVKLAEKKIIERGVEKARNCLHKEFGCLPHEMKDSLVESGLSAQIGPLQVKCKDDLWWNRNLIDVKTISNFPKKGKFLSHIHKYKYDLKYEHYSLVNRLNGYEVDQYYWLFIETVWPYRVRLIPAPTILFENANLRDRLEECYERYVSLADFEPDTIVQLEDEQWYVNLYGDEIDWSGSERL